MKKQFIYILIHLICFLFTILLLGIITAPIAWTQNNELSITGQLVYTRLIRNNPDVYQYVLRTDSVIYTFERPIEACASLSPNGDRIASYDALHNLVSVFDIRTGERIAEVGWTPENPYCNISWQDNQTLHMSITSDTQQVLNLVTGQVETQAEDTISDFSAIFAELPFFAPKSRYGYQLAHGQDLNLIAYGQCFEIVNDECRSKPEVVLYDRQVDVVVERLTDANPLVLGDNPEHPSSIPSPDLPQIYWSPSNRYVLYVTSDPGGFTYKIYDLKHDTYSSFQLPSGTYHYHNSERANWSQDESRVGFWVHNTTDSPTSGATLFTYNLQMETTQHLKTKSYSTIDWTFSPTGDAIALVDTAAQLIIIDLSTGVDYVLDDKTQSIRAWVNTD